MSNQDGWIGVDLDGTLAHYDEWRGPEHIGAPIKAMVDIVRGWIEMGQEVRIFTARVYDDPDDIALGAIAEWCLEHIGHILTVTNEKDYGMIELWDDRAVCVERNTGKVLGRNE
jgi:hypothetical protein